MIGDHEVGDLVATLVPLCLSRVPPSSAVVMSCIAALPRVAWPRCSWPAISCSIDPLRSRCLFPQLAADPSFVERFRREAQSAANLSHPNIVGVYDWGREGNTYYIVMEYVQGQSLSEILRDEGPLDPHRAAQIADDVAAALGFAHKNDSSTAT